MLSPRRTTGAAVLLLAAAGLAALLLLKHHGIGTPADAICGEGTKSGCDLVNRSAYAEVAGVPLAAIGLVFYLALGGTLALASFAADAARAAVARAVLGLLALSLAVDLVLLGIQAVKLEAYCTLCLSTYALAAVAFALLLPARSAALAPLGAGEGRLAAAGAVILAVGTLAAAAAFQGVIRGRPADPAALFGARTPAAPAAPAATAADTGDARQEAQRLQGILDDPQKLDRYFLDKAVKEFEQAKVESFDLTGVPLKGPSDAPLKIVEFSDFLCPFCAQLAQGLSAFLPQLKGRAAVYYKQYPLESACNPGMHQSIHPGACVIAMGGICAGDQNRFWQYHDVAFSRLGQLKTRADAQQAAAAAGLDAAAFSACMDRPATAERLKAQVNEGAAAGVKGTPTVFLNGKRVNNLNYFAAILEKESARLGLPPLASPPPPAR